MEADYERFAICTGEVTEDELKYLLKTGQIVEKDGQYFDVETLTESDLESDLEDSMKENVSPNPISLSEATSSEHFDKLDRSCPSSMLAQLSITENQSSFCGMKPSKFNADFVSSKVKSLNQTLTESPFCDMDFSKLNESFVPSEKTNMFNTTVKESSYANMDGSKLNESSVPSIASKLQTTKESSLYNDANNWKACYYKFKYTKPELPEVLELKESSELPDSQHNKTSTGLNGSSALLDSQLDQTSTGLNGSSALLDSQLDQTSTGLNGSSALLDSQLDKTSTGLNGSSELFDPQLNKTTTRLNDSSAELPDSQLDKTSTGWDDSSELPDSQLNKTVTELNNTLNNFGSQEPRLNQTGNENRFSNMNISTLNESFVPSYAVPQNKEIAGKPFFDNLSVSFNSRISTLTDGTISGEIAEETGPVCILPVSELSDAFTSSNGIQPLNKTPYESLFANMDISKLNESYIPTSGTKLNKTKTASETSFGGLEDTSKSIVGSPLSSSTSARRSKTTRESSLRKAAIESSFSKMNNSKLNESCTTNEIHSQAGKVSFSNFDRSRENESLFSTGTGTQLYETAQDASFSTSMNASEIVSEHEDTIDLMDQLLAQADELEKEDGLQRTPLKFTPQRRVTPSPQSPSPSPLKNKRLSGFEQKGTLSSPSPSPGQLKAASPVSVFKTPASKLKTPRLKSFVNVPAKVDSGLRKLTTPCLGLDSPVADYIHSKPVPLPFHRVTGLPQKIMSIEEQDGLKSNGDSSMIPRPSLPTLFASSHHNAQMFSAQDNKFKPHQYTGPTATVLYNSSFAEKHQKENYLAERHTGIREENADASVVQGAVIPKKFIQSKLVPPRSYYVS